MHDNREREDRAFGRRIVMAYVVLAAFAVVLILASQAHADVLLGAPVTDAGVDVPLIAHVDAGDPSPLTGDVLNTAAERHVLAACGVDAGAPVAPPDSSCASTIVGVATFLAGVGLGVYLHQRETH